MRCTIKKILLSGALLTSTLFTGCHSNVNKVLYDTIQLYDTTQNRNEHLKTPHERALTPTPSYDAYKKERETLKQNDPVQDKNESTDFSLK